MLKRILQSLDERFLFPYRYQNLVQRLHPLLTAAPSILDVGTGDGHLASYLMQATCSHVTGLDVCLQPHPYINIHLYDGHTFPFEDNSFDCVLMVDMLHHTNNIERMIAEANRVAREFIVIKDHYWITRADWLALRAADYLGNMPYGVPLPYNYLRLDEWKDLFIRHKLNELTCATFKYSRLEPAYHLMAKLQVETPSGVLTSFRPVEQVYDAETSALQMNPP